MTNTIIKINNKKYMICYDINVLCQMKSEGLDIMKLNKDMDILAIRSLFYYGLIKFNNKPKLTPEKAGDLMSAFLADGGTIQDIAEIMLSALYKGLGIKEQSENDDMGE